MTADQRTLASRSAPYLVAVGVAVAYLLWAPHTPDLAAQTARGELFRRSGFVPFWIGWYAGIPTASYSLIAPPLLGWLGPVGLGALSIGATAPVAVPLLRDATRPRLGAAFFVLAAGFDVFSGRTTFALGVVLALAAVLAAERRRLGTAVLLAGVATAASPVAGFLLLVVAVALWLADPGRRRVAGGIAVGVLIVLGVLAILSTGGQGGGYEPLSRQSLLTATGTALVAGVLPVGRRVRVGVAVTLMMLVALYFVHSPIGANATRLAILGTAPTIVAAARAPRWLLVAGVAIASLMPLSQLHSDVRTATGNYTSQAFVAPLRSELVADPTLRDHRVELVDTSTHWPTAYLLPAVMLARGWERQVDEDLNPEFYGRAALTATTYRAFLDRNAVAFVAEPVGVGIDYGSKAEAALIAGGLPYLSQVWSDPGWKLYAVAQPTSIVAAPATVTSTSDTGLTVDVPRPGSYPVRMRWSPYFVVDGGHVKHAADGDITLVLDTGGTHRLQAVWRLPTIR